MRRGLVAACILTMLVVSGVPLVDDAAGAPPGAIAGVVPEPDVRGAVRHRAAAESSPPGDAAGGLPSAVKYSAPEPLDPEFPWPDSPANLPPLEEIEARLDEGVPEGEEIVEERTETSKTFETETPGVLRTEFTEVPQHRLDEQGGWEDLDPLLEELPDGDLAPKTAYYETSLGGRADAPALARIEVGDGLSVGYRLAGAAASEAESELNTALYREAFEGVDVELSTIALGVKEVLYLRDPTVPTEYVYPLQLEGLTPRIDESGAVVFDDASGVARAQMPAAFMEDAALDPVTGEGALSYDVSYELIEVDGVPAVKMTLDRDWLSAPERVFPVRVDPLFYGFFTSGTDDTWVDSVTPANRSALTDLRVGQDASSQTRSFIQVDQLDDLAGKNIHTAQINLVQHTVGTNCTPNWLDVYRVPGTWTGATTTTWPGPATAELVGSAQSATGPSCGGGSTVKVNLVPLVQGWADLAYPNNGVALRARNETDPNNFKKFYSAQGSAFYRPSFGVIWSDKSPSQAPAVPTELEPVGTTSSQTPEFGAYYVDPQGDSGTVTFLVYRDDEEGAFVGSIGATATSGQVAKVTSPFTLEWDQPYKLQAFAYDASQNVSANSAFVTFTPKQVTSVSGVISQDTVWGPQGSPYVIDTSGGAFMVDSGVSLTLLPGTIVKVKGTNQVYVRGQLISLGTSAQPVVITSIRDDAAGGDTNGVVGAPAPGDWLHLFNNSWGPGTIVLDHTVVRYGGAGGTSLVRADAITTLLVSNSVFADSAGWGINSGGGPVPRTAVHSSTFRDSVGGIQGDGFDIVGNHFDESLSSRAIEHSHPYAGVGVARYNVFEAPLSIGGGGDWRYNTFLLDTGAEFVGWNNPDMRYNWWGHVLDSPPTQCMAVYGDDHVPVIIPGYPDVDCPNWERGSHYQSNVLPALGAAPPTDTPAQTEAHAPFVGPVNGYTGELSWSDTDLVIKDAGQDVAIERTYGSQSTGTGDLGAGWATSFNESVAADAFGGGVTTFSDGSQIGFQGDPDAGMAIPGPGNNAKWTSDAGGSSLTMADNTEYNFNAAGELTGVVMRDPGREIDVDSAGGLLDKITGVSGRYVDFSHSNGKLASAVDSQGRDVLYSVSGGLLQSVTGVDDKVYTYGYSGGKLTAVTSPMSRPLLRAGYDGEKVQWFEEAGGGRVDVAYFPDDQYTTFTYADGAVLRTDYDDKGRLVHETVGSVRGRHVIYDGEGRITAEVDNLPTGPMTGYGPELTITFFDKNGDPVEVRDTYDRKTTTTFNSDHQPLVTTYPDNTTTGRTYTTKRLTSVVDQAGRTWNATFNGFGEITSLDDPKPNTGGRVAAQWTYLANGDPQSHRNTANQATNVGVDALGRVTSVTDPLSRATSFEYTTWGEVRKTTTPRGAVTESFFNDDRQAVDEVRPEARTTHYQYDSMGRLWKQTDGWNYAAGTPFPEAATTELGYDSVGRVLTVKDPKGGTFSRTYNHAGDVTSETDATTAATNYTLDPGGRPLTVVDADTNETTTTYDRVGNVRQTTHPDGGVELWTYDVMGREQTYTNTLGGVWQTTYDALGQPDVITDPVVQSPDGKVDLNWDEVGNMVSRQDQNGRTTTFTYDNADRPTGASDGEGSLGSNTYNAAGELDSSSTGVAGETTNYQYTTDGQLQKSVHPEAIDFATGSLARGETENTQIDLAGRIIRMADPLDRESVTEYDHLDRVTRITYPDATTQEFTYDLNGNVTDRKDRAGEHWLYTFDAANRVLTETDPEGGVTHHGWTSIGEEAHAIDPTGIKTAFTYDAMSRRTSAQIVAGGGPPLPSPAPAADTWGYATDGQVTAQNVGGVSATLGYNTAGWQTAVTDGAGRSTTFAHDKVGNQVSSTNPLFKTRSMTYDDRNRVETVTDETNRTWTSAYDLADRRTSVKWPSWNEGAQTGRRDRWTYDKVGRLATSIDGLGRTTTMTYDLAGQQRKVDVPGSGSFTYEYTAGGWVQKESRVNEAGFRAYTYDGEGRLLTTTLPSAQVFAITRDGVGRPTREQSGSVSHWFGYDAAGRQSWAHGPTASAPSSPTTNAELRWTYDGAGRLATSNSGGAALSYGYDDRSRLASENAGGVTSTYTYDSRSLLSSIGGAGAVSFGYDDAGRMTSATAGTASQTFGYDDAGRETSTTMQRSDLAPQQVSATSLAYTADGLVDTQSQSVGATVTTDDATYDNAGSLDAFTRQVTDGSGPLGTATIDYTWDNAGNRTAVSASGVSGSGAADPLSPEALGVEGNGTVNYTYTAASRLLSSTDGRTYTHDADGHLIRQTDSNGPDAAYNYDAFDRVIAVREGEGTSPPVVVTYGRDALGRLDVRTPTGGSASRITYDGAGTNPAVYDPDGSGSVPATTLISDPGERLWQTSTSGATSLVAETSHGDTAAVTRTAAGQPALASSHVFDPFGNATTDGTWDSPLGFQGMIQDPIGGLVDMTARSYDPTLGRFAQADTYRGDPTNQISLNRYSYGNADPLNHFDPDGHFSFKDAVKWGKKTAGKVWDATGGRAATYLNDNVVQPLWRQARGAASATKEFFDTQVVDRAKRGYHSARDKAEEAVAWTDRNVAQQVRRGVGSATDFIKDNQNLIVAVGASVLVGTACTLSTAGFGAGVCMVAAGATFGAITGGQRHCGAGHSDMECAAGVVGYGTAGALAGLAGAGGAALPGAWGYAAGGAAFNGAFSTGEQYLQTGRVDAGQVLQASVVGGLLGGAGYGAGRAFSRLGARISPSGASSMVDELATRSTGPRWGGRMQGDRGGTGPSPTIEAAEVTGQTRSGIRDLARDRGLIPRGRPDPTDGLPRRWHDPVTGEERLRLDRGHVDPATGQPFNNPRAAVDHCHLYGPTGCVVVDPVSSDKHFPTTGP